MFMLVCEATTDQRIQGCCIDDEYLMVVTEGMCSVWGDVCGERASVPVAGVGSGVAHQSVSSQGGQTSRVD